MSAYIDETPPPPSPSDAPPTYASLGPTRPSQNPPYTDHSSQHHNFHNPQIGHPYLDEDETADQELQQIEEQEREDPTGTESDLGAFEAESYEELGQNDPPPPYSPGLRSILAAGISDAPAYDAPPSYHSLFGQIREARQQATNSWSFLRRLGQIILNTVGCTILLVVFMSVPIVILVIGAVYFGQCPLEPNIPIFLIVGGLSGMLKNVFLIIENIVKRYSTTLSSRVKRPKYIIFAWRAGNLIFNLFILSWIIAGSYWVYHIYKEVDAMDYSTCNQLLYKFSFGIVTSSYILLLLMCCCTCCFAGVCLKRNKQRTTTSGSDSGSGDNNGSNQGGSDSSDDEEGGSERAGSNQEIELRGLGGVEGVDSRSLTSGNDHSQSEFDSTSYPSGFYLQDLTEEVDLNTNVIDPNTDTADPNVDTADLSTDTADPNDIDNHTYNTTIGPTSDIVDQRRQTRHSQPPNPSQQNNSILPASLPVTQQRPNGAAIFQFDQSPYPTRHSMKQVRRIANNPLLRRNLSEREENRMATTNYAESPVLSPARHLHYHHQQQQQSCRSDCPNSSPLLESDSILSTGRRAATECGHDGSSLYITLSSDGFSCTAV